MTTEIRIPKLGMSMTEATLQEWLVSDGTTVEAGTPIYSIETDKSVTEVEAPASGTLRVLAQTEETYPIGHLIGQIDAV